MFVQLLHQKKKKFNKLYVLINSLTNVDEQIYNIIHFKDFITCIQQPQYIWLFHDAPMGIMLSSVKMETRLINIPMAHVWH